MAWPRCLLRMLLFFPSPTGSNSLLKQFWRPLRNPPVDNNFPYPVFSELNFYAGGRATARPEIGVRRLALRRAISNLIDNAIKYGGGAAVGVAVHAGDRNC